MLMSYKLIYITYVFRIAIFKNIFVAYFPRWGRFVSALARKKFQHEPSSKKHMHHRRPAILKATMSGVCNLHVSETFAFYKFTLDIAPKIPPQTLSSTHQICFIGFFVRSQPQKHQDTTTVLPWTSNIDEAPRNRKTINLDICECTPILRQRDIDTSKDLPRKNAIGCQILGKSIVGKYRGGVKMIMVPSAKKYIQYVPLWENHIKFRHACDATLLPCSVRKIFKKNLPLASQKLNTLRNRNARPTFRSCCQFNPKYTASAKDEHRIRPVKAASAFNHGWLVRGATGRNMTTGIQANAK